MIGVFVSRTKEVFIDSLVSRLKDEVLFEELYRYLPFAVSLKQGSTHEHIVNESVYPVQTEVRTVYQGESLCGRRRAFLDHKYAQRKHYTACPGCLAIGRGIAVRDLI